LIKRCESIVVDDRLKEPYSLKTFQKFLEVAETKLVELERLKKEYDEQSVLSENFDHSVSLQKEALVEYTRKIQFLKDLQNREKMILGTNESQKRAAKIVRNMYMTHAEKNTELEMLAKVKNAAVQDMRKLLIPEPDVPDEKKNDTHVPENDTSNIDTSSDNKESHDNDSKSKTNRTTPQLSKNVNSSGDNFEIVDKILSKDVDEREKLTEIMEKLTKRIKEIYHQNHDRIVADKPVVQRMEDVIKENIEQAKHGNVGLSEIKNNSTNTTLIYYVLILIVIIVFFCMFSWIKLFPK